MPADSPTSGFSFSKELRSFVDEMQIPFISTDREQSVMRQASEPGGDLQTREKQAWENIISLGAAAAPISRVAGPLLRAMGAFPKTAAVAGAAATQDPTMLATGPIGSALTYSPETEAAIRPGGLPDLNMTHNMSGTIESMLGLLTGRKSLSSPSIAISRGGIHPFNSSPTLVFNPTSKLLEPGRGNANQLFNRDAYVDTGKSPRTTRELREQNDMRFSQGESGSLGQDLAIAASPRFANFRQFESHPQGAKLLEPHIKMKDYMYPEVQSTLQEAGEKAGDINLFARMFPETAVRALGAEANKGNTAALSVLAQVKHAPSDYAELKVAGEVPITPQNVSAVVIPSWWKDAKDKIPEIQAALPGVRVGTAESLAPPHVNKVVENLADLITRRAQKDAVRTQKATNATDYEAVEREVTDSLPSYITRYLTPEQYIDITLTTHLQNPKRISAWIKSSDAFDATVASALTQQDIDTFRRATGGRKP